MAATNVLTNLAASSAATNDIRDIKPLMAISNPWLWIWLALGLIVVVAAAVYVIRRIRQSAQTANAVPLEPAHVRARRKLEAALALLAQPKEFVTTVSDTLRFYIEESFALRAPERTTEEFLNELTDTSVLTDAQKSSLAGFLQQCDLVKFARHEPGEQELHDLHSAALRFVDETEPVPTEELPSTDDTTGTLPPQHVGGAQHASA